MEKHNAYVETSEDLTVPEEVLAARTAPDQVDLRSMPWFFDNIPKQNALELLKEHVEDGSFIIRESDTYGQFAMSWIAQGRNIKHAEIPMVNGLYFLENAAFHSLQSLINFAVEQNFISMPLANKELHKCASQQRIKRRMGRLSFAGGVKVYGRYSLLRGQK